MANESGDMKLLDSFRQFIDLLAAEPAYNPPNPKIKTTTMNAQYTAGLASAQDVPTKQAPNKSAITDRQDLFDQLPGRLRRSLNVAKASGVAKSKLADLQPAARKVLGKRATPKVKVDPKTPATEAAKTHSAAQTSFANQAGNYGAYLAALETSPEYQP